jgi:hypothetical protein
VRRLLRWFEAACESAMRLLDPRYARLCDTWAAREAEDADMRAALAGELPADHPMTRYVETLRSAGLL